MLDAIVTDDDKFIQELVNDREKFDNFVYFSTMEEAMIELEKRRNDNELQKKVTEYFKYIGIPEVFEGEPRLVLFRQVATPNIEVSRFLIIADGVEMKPLFLEYYDDKFTSNNELKLSLGKLGFYEGVGKKGGSKINYKTIIDFNKFNGKKISEVKTLWGEKLTDFHRSLFSVNYDHIDGSVFFEGSKWFEACGGDAIKYYETFLALMIRDGILLENFMLSESEHMFTKQVFLPAFKFVYDYFGIKPIIVALNPTQIEAEEFWFCQNPKTQLWFKENKCKI
ncbi:MAG: hypothetical protein V4509_02080 [Patescibacteria group bacterium]